MAVFKLSSCRSVNVYKKLNRIEEGTYGIVYRAQDSETGDIVALKKLKLEKEKEGFPITSLREITTLTLLNHPNIVRIREVVIGSELTSVFIVMDFVEHDLKSLLDQMPSAFGVSEVKTMMRQLLGAICTLHAHWILHRDLKTSNLLFNNCGQIKVADFGLARKFGDPIGKMTPLVVTLWYRAPELLLGAVEYSEKVDLWSIGCIMAELLLKRPLFQGQSEIDQLYQIFKVLGTPSEKIWPGYTKLPNLKIATFPTQPYNYLRSKFAMLSDAGLDLLNRLLTFDPTKRISAERALEHPWFNEPPLPKDPRMFPTWPSKASGEKQVSSHASMYCHSRFALILVLSLSFLLLDNLLCRRKSHSETPSAPHAHQPSAYKDGLSEDPGSLKRMMREKNYDFVFCDREYGTMHSKNK